LPDQPGDEPPNPYHVSLPDLTGRHGYALVRGEDDDEEPDPGAPVAYVAAPMKERPNALTIEGMIAGIGQAAQGAAKEGGSSAWMMRVLVVMFLLPAAVLLLRAFGVVH
jgi:hypothetical protein